MDNSNNLTYKSDDNSLYNKYLNQYKSNDKSNSNDDSYIPKLNPEYNNNSMLKLEKKRSSDDMSINYENLELNLRSAYSYPSNSKPFEKTNDFTNKGLLIQLILYFLFFS